MRASNSHSEPSGLVLHGVANEEETCRIIATEAILEWRDPVVVADVGSVGRERKDFSRYWDKLTFLRSRGLPLPPSE